ncbi:hypothetical protein GCM10009548_39280 [Streptomyces malaysiensis subsp. malaysiensis]
MNSASTWPSRSAGTPTTRSCPTTPAPPSGFEWEVGWNPIVIDETTWEPTTYRSISDWGHLPVGRTILDQLEQFRVGARSLARPERTVPALGGSGTPDD